MTKTEKSNASAVKTGVYLKEVQDHGYGDCYRSENKRARADTVAAAADEENGKKAEDYHDGNHGIEHPVDFNVKQHGKDVVHNIHSKKKFRRQGERNFNTNEYFLTQALP